MMSDLPLASGHAGPKVAARGSWGPFVPNLDWPERKARVRALRTCIRLLTGERGKAAAFALLRIEVQGPDQDLMDTAAAVFDKLASLDRGRVLASFSAVNFEPAATRTVSRVGP